MKLQLASLIVFSLFASPILADDSPSSSVVTGSEVPIALVETVPALLATDGPVTCNSGSADAFDGGSIRASCTADCGSAPNVSCSASGQCNAVDRNCGAGEPGHVTCGSSTTYCPACDCTDGQVRYISTSQCCCDYTIEWAPKNRKKVIKQTCANGNWVYHSFSCSGQNCPGSCPL